MGFCKRSVVRSSNGDGFCCEVIEGSTMAELVDMAIVNPPLPPLCKGGTYRRRASKTRVSNPCSEVDQDQLSTT